MSYVIFWGGIKSNFALTFGEETANFLFHGSIILDVRGNDIFISADELSVSLFKKEGSEVGAYLQKSLDEHFNQPMNIHFTNEGSIPEVATNQQLPHLDIDNIKVETRPGYESTNLDQTKHLHNYFYSSDNLQVINTCNVIVKELSSTGKTSMNPLFIHGESGIGKTHIVNALGNKMYEEFSDLNILYLRATDFLDQYTRLFRQALEHEKIEEYKGIFKELDVLIIDDIQMLQQKESTLNFLFNIYEDLAAKDKLIILTCDINPNKLNINDRLLTRFLSGIVIEMNIPDTDTRTEIFKYNAQDLEQLDFEDNAIQTFIQNSESVRTLAGYVNAVRIHYMTYEQKFIDRLDKINELRAEEGRDLKTRSPFTVEDALEILKQGSGESVKLTKTDIIDIICNYFEIEEKVLKSSSRKQDIVIARQLCLIYLKEYIGMTQQEIAQEVGYNDHSSVSKVLTDQEAIKKKYQHQCNELEKKMKKIK